MDDDMEDEIICELFTAHVHIIWRYIGVTSAGLADMIMPAPGESFKSKLLQPGPFMVIMFLAIVASVCLQSSSHWVQHYFQKLNNVVGLNTLTDRSLKSFVAESISAGHVSQELRDGIVGAYSVQGRRGNMEDRFCIMQNVDVGGDKVISFFGVYDGHGGQFVADYVKEHLFQVTIEKIRQLRGDPPSNKPEKPNKSGKFGGSDKRKKSGTSVSSSSGTHGRKTERSEHEQNKENIPESGKDDGKAASISEVNGKIYSKICSIVNTNVENEKTESKTCSNGQTPQKNGCIGGQTNEACPRRGSGVETLEIEKAEMSSSCNGDTPMKKDDPYNSVNIRKRGSLSGNGKDTPANSKEKNKSEKNQNDSLYVDVHKNINYTKLLTDQIMHIDSRVVEQCKSRTDLSGTTAVVAVLDGELLIIGNVGDSRAVMGDTKGATIPLSFDHKPNQLKERRRIKEAGGFITFNGVWRVAGILATSRALGDFPLKDPRQLITAEPDVLTFSLRDHKAHFVILATDGLWDVLSNEEAVAYVRDHIQEEDFGAKSLSYHAYNLGSQDNITVVILNISKLGLQM